MKAVQAYPLLGGLILFVILLAFAGCAPETSRWSPAEAPLENKVDLIRLSHAVQFRPGDERLDPSEAQRLAQFLERIRAGYGDRITLLGGDDVLARRQRDAVATMLTRAGLGANPAQPTEGVVATPGEVRVIVARYVVTPPPCPNWAKPPQEDYANTRSSNFGCASARNLGAMIADPGDLVAGRTPGPADGELAAFRIESYRRGMFPPLLRGDASPNGRTDIVKGAK